MDWWLQIDGEASGAYNMAKDEHWLARAAAGAPPTLRLYGWERLTLSVGRAQRIDRELDVAACRVADVPLVRRPTGGRAVLHGSDLTYAVTAPLRPPFQGGIMTIYRELSRAFVRFFESLGREPQVKAYTGRQRAELVSDICFATPSAFEILLDGRKVVGSAQRLLPGGFLQHGSMPLAPQYALLARLFRGGSEAALREQMTDLAREGVVPPLTLGEVQERLVWAFADVFGVRLVPAPWDEGDEAAVRTLMAGYGDPAAQTAPGPAGALAAGAAATGE